MYCAMEFFSSEVIFGIEHSMIFMYRYVLFINIAACFLTPNELFTSNYFSCVQAFKEQELPGDIAKRIKQQEEKIQQQQHELEKLRQETKLAQEEWQRRRESEQQELFRRQREELEKLKEKLREMELKRADNDGQQQQQVHCI